MIFNGFGNKFPKHRWNDADIRSTGRFLYIRPGTKNRLICIGQKKAPRYGGAMVFSCICDLVTLQDMVQALPVDITGGGIEVVTPTEWWAVGCICRADIRQRSSIIVEPFIDNEIDVW